MRNIILPLLLSFLLSSQTAFAQSVFDQMYDGTVDAPLSMVITMPVDSILAKSRNDQPGTVSYTAVDGSVQSWTVDLEIRGKFRRGRCGYPPLKLNFSKKDLRKAGLTEHDKLKLVTTCFEDTLATTLLLKEYLAYRAYALLSPEAHFRTQLLQVTYRDASGQHPDRVAYAFVIEDNDEMAERTGGKKLDSAIGLEPSRYDEQAEATHALFQYLIGNGDWSLNQHRNIKVVERPDGKMIPVGYDFDFSGWVGSPYASPSSEIGQKSIYQRIYLGYNQSDRTLRQVNQQFREKRRELLRMVSDFELLSKTERTILQRFIHRFYDETGTMSANTSTLFYDQLRGSSAAIIPPGSPARFYQTRATR